MPKPKLILTILILASFFFIPASPADKLLFSPTSASVTSQKYKEYKAKYRNKEDKTTYFKIKTLKKDNPKLYLYYKSLCISHRYDTPKQFEKLSEKTQDICNQYYTYRGYRQYVHYRNKHRNSSNGTTATTAAPFVCGTSTVQDADGNSYNTVQVNDQCWMAENLNVGTMLASAATDPTDNSVIEKWCYNDDPAICATDGGLYAWNEAMQYITTEGARGICPTGWHIPTGAQWYDLENYLKDEGQSCLSDRIVYACDTAGAKIKVGGSSNFNAPLSGFRSSTSKTYSSRGSYARIRSSSLDGTTYAWTREIKSTNTTINRYSTQLLQGNSIRCLKD